MKRGRKQGGEENRREGKRKDRRGGEKRSHRPRLKGREWERGNMGRMGESEEKGERKIKRKADVRT